MHFREDILRFEKMMKRQPGDDSEPSTSQLINQHGILPTPLCFSLIPNCLSRGW
jgi:hypothetical protein